MAGYDAALINLVDSRIRAHSRKDWAVGTLVSVSGSYAYVAMDGSSLALPCKYVGGLTLNPDTRVIVNRIGSDWTITSSFAKGYWPKYAYDQTVIAGATNTSAALGSPAVGFTFLAPPSGAVLVTVGGYIGQANNANSAHLSYSIRTGDDWSTGIGVTSFDYRRSIMAGKAVNAGAVAEAGGTNTTPVEGLEPGFPYIIRTGHWTAPAGAITVHARYVQVDAIR